MPLSSSLLSAIRRRRYISSTASNDAYPIGLQRLQLAPDLAQMIVYLSTYKQWMYNPATVDRLIIIRSRKNGLSPVLPLHIYNRPCRPRRDSICTSRASFVLSRPKPIAKVALSAVARSPLSWPYLEGAGNVENGIRSANEA